MCLTVPKKVISVKGTRARVDTGTIDVSIVNEPKPGDWVLVNANLALKKVSASEAKKILTLLNHD